MAPPQQPFEEQEGSFPQTSRGNEGESAAEQEPGCGLFRRSLRRRPPLHPQSVHNKKQTEAVGFSLERLPGDSSLLWIFHGFSSWCGTRELFAGPKRQPLSCVPVAVLQLQKVITVLVGRVTSKVLRLAGFLCRPGRSGMQKTPAELPSPGTWLLSYHRQISHFAIETELVKQKQIMLA